MNAGLEAKSNARAGRPTISVGIPTYGRDQVLIETIEMLLEQTVRADAILIADQTPSHPEPYEQKLAMWDREKVIEWRRLEVPSITRSMNYLLQVAKTDLVLFLDDDIIPAPGLIESHLQAVKELDVWAVVGQVLQPGQESEDVEQPLGPGGLIEDLNFPFHSTKSASVSNVMAGNLCVWRERALDVGGFDERFVRVAYRFETDFARRIRRAGGAIRYEPGASIRHLRAARGGTRAYRNHLTSSRPDHSVGDYLFALKHGRFLEMCRYSLWRMIRSVSTKFHLRQPWWILPKLIGEVRGFCWALTLHSSPHQFSRWEETAEDTENGGDEQIQSIFSDSRVS